MANPWQWIDQTALDEDKTRQELEEWKHVQRRKLADDWVVKQKELVRVQFEQLAKIREAQFDQPEIRASQITQPTVESQVQTPIEPEVLGPAQPKPEVLGPPTLSALDRVAEYRRTMKPPKLFGVPMELPEAKPEQSFAETLLNAARPFGEKAQESGEWADQKYREVLLRLGDDISGRKGRRLEDREAEARRGFTPMIPEGTPRAVAGFLGEVLNRAFTGNVIGGMDATTAARLQRENPELFEKLLREQHVRTKADWERWKTEEVNPAVEMAGSLTNPLGWLGGGSVAQMARAGLGLPKILKASEAAEKAIKSAPKVIEGTSRVLSDVPVGMGIEYVNKSIADKFREGLKARSVFEGGEVLPNINTAWRSMGEKEYETLLAGKPLGGPDKAGKRGGYFSWFPARAESERGTTKSPKYLVEFKNVGTEFEGTTRPVSFADISAVWKSAGGEWQRIDAPAGMGTKAKTQGILLNRFEEPGVPVGSPDKPHGLYTTPADVQSPHGDLGGEQSTWRLLPEAKMLDVTPYEGKSIAMRRDAIDAGAGVHAARYLLGDVEFTRLKNLPKTSLISEAEKMFHNTNVEWNRYYDSQEVMEAIGAMKAREQGYDAIRVIDPKDPAFTEVVLLNSKSAQLEPKIGEITSKIKPSIGLSVEDVPGPNTMKDVSQFFSGLGKDMGRMAREADLRAAEKKMSNLRKQHPDVTDEQVASTPLGQQIARYKQELGLTSPVEPPLTTPGRQSTVDDTAGGGLAGAAIGGLGSKSLGMGIKDITKPQPFNIRRTGNKFADELLDKYTDRKPINPPSPKQIFDTLVRGTTDNKIDLIRYQNIGKKALGRELNPLENLEELKRFNVDAAAGQILDETLGVIYRDIGADLPDLSRYVTLKHDLEIAKVQNNPKRRFTGGRTVIETQQAFDDLRATLDPIILTKVEKATDQIKDFVQSRRQFMVDSGVWTPDFMKQLQADYPYYVPTRLIDSAVSPKSVSRKSSTLRVGNIGVQRLTKTGMLAEREDPLSSLIRLTYETERKGRQNIAFNAFLKIREADPILKKSIKKTSKDAPGEAVINGYDHGKSVSFRVPNSMKTIIENPNIIKIPVVSFLTQAQRAVYTSLNPAWIVGNALLDAGSYMLAATMREPGPLKRTVNSVIDSLLAPVQFPKVMYELIKAYPDTFSGLTKGRFTGPATSQYLKEGGGMTGFFGGKTEHAERTLDRLTRDNVFVIRSRKDIEKLALDTLSVQFIPSLGERVELAPRVAQMNLSLKRGRSPQTAVIGQGRTVTLDFQRGGNWVKQLNEMLLFFNVGVQAAVQIPRLFKENPVSFMSTVSALLGGPLIASEIWNRQDEQTAKDYKNTPQYIKDQGIVFMLPEWLVGKAPVDKQGNRRPHKVLLPLREWATIVISSREAITRAMGEDARDWSDLAIAMGYSISPIKGSTSMDATTGFMTGPVSTAAQLGFNRDTFRNRILATDAADERASQASNTIAEKLNVRPSQVEFAIRDLGGAPGEMALGLSNTLVGKQSQQEGSEVRSIPGIGVVLGRFIKSNIGGNLDASQNKLLAYDLNDMLSNSGVRLDIQPVGSTISKIPLTMDEQASYQLLTNLYVDQALRNLLFQPYYWQAEKDQRKQLAQSAVSAARGKAGNIIQSTISQTDKNIKLMQTYGTTEPKNATLTTEQKEQLLR